MPSIVDVSFQPLNPVGGLFATLQRSMQLGCAGSQGVSISTCCYSDADEVEAQHNSVLKRRRMLMQAVAT